MAKGFRFRNKSATKDLDDPLARVKVNKMRLTRTWVKMGRATARGDATALGQIGSDLAKRLRLAI